MVEEIMQEYAKVNAKQPFVEFIIMALATFKNKYHYKPDAIMVNSAHSEDGIVEAQYSDFDIMFTKAVAISSVRFGPVVKKRTPRLFPKELNREPSI